MSRYPKLTQDAFLERARARHGERYDYSQVEIVSAQSLVCITCRKCGLHFQQLAKRHLEGQGCTFCSHTTNTRKVIGARRSETARAELIVLPWYPSPVAAHHRLANLPRSHKS